MMRPVAAAVAVVVGLFGLVFFGIMLLVRAECDAQAQIMKVDHSWGALTGCMIKAPKTGQWVPLKAYRVID